MYETKENLLSEGGNLRSRLASHVNAGMMQETARKEGPRMASTGFADNLSGEPRHSRYISGNAPRTSGLVWT